MGAHVARLVGVGLNLGAEAVLEDRRAELERWREVSTSTEFDA